ncbi:MAG: SoxR reducing system RseC family protein, partial [Bacillota bacterium]|nr:SoxR reducing system RseC family protein [Bacillota bacterium]
MNKEQEGIVIELNDSVAKVKVARHGDCENCGSCPGNKAMVLEVNNRFGAQKGDKVVFEQRQESMLKAAFIVYILPLLAIFVGSEIGIAVSNAINVQAIGLEIAGGAIAFVLSIMFIIHYEKSSRSNINKL